MSSKGKSSKRNKKRSSRKLLCVQDTVEEEEGDGDGDDDETYDQVTEGGDDYSDDQTADDASVSTSVTADKPEVKEAQLRLNRFLDGVTAAAALEGADDGSESDRGGGLAASSSPAVYDGTPRKQNTTPGMGDDPGGEPTENTSLLSTPLKPSIFTSIAEIAEKSSSKQPSSAAAEGETGEDQKVLSA